MQGEYTKVCGRCKVEKFLTEFGKHKSRKDGLRNSCKECNNAAAKDYVKRNHLKVLESKRIKRLDPEYRAKDCEYARKRYAEDESYREYSKEHSKTYFQENKNDPEFRSKNATRKANWERSKLNDPAFIANRKSRCSKRRASKLNAIPKWLTKEDILYIQDIYEIAAAFKLYTGQDYHVDHILPLQGKTVCGLHCPANLRVIPAAENLSKSNKLIDPEAWD